MAARKKKVVQRDPQVLFTAVHNQLVSQLGIGLESIRRQTARDVLKEIQERLLPMKRVSHPALQEILGEVLEKFTQNEWMNNISDRMRKG